MDISLWRLEINHKDHLVFAGCDMVDLAGKYGTPLYLINETMVRTNYNRFISAFKRYYQDVKVFYSYKTNCVPAVLNILRKEGCGAEVVSPYEFWLAHYLKTEPSEIIYNGINKSEEDLRTALQKGVGLINLDSLEELDKLKRIADDPGEKVNIGVRVHLQNGWRQFGVQQDGDNIISFFKEIHKSDFLDPCCLHIHFGTGIRATGPYKKRIKKICILMKELKDKAGITLKYLDLGGGFGIPAVKTFSLPEMALYKIFNIPPKKPDINRCPSIENFAEDISVCLIECLERYNLEKPMLLLEPGRAITGDSQILLVTVGDIKNRSVGSNFAITDGGMQNVAFPLSYEYHECLLANRASAIKKEKYFVTGPLCSPEDLLYRKWRLPDLRKGDIISIMDAGAYFISFSNNFSYPRPAIVIANNGSHRIIREREDFKHLIALDRVRGDK